MEIEPGSYLFRVKYTKNDDSLYVDYDSFTLQNIEDAKDRILWLKKYHKNEAKSEIVVSYAYDKEHGDEYTH